VAIKVSGGHLVPVIVRASGRGRQAGWAATARVMWPRLRIKAESLLESHSGAPPKSPRVVGRAAYWRVNTAWMVIMSG
jgi:hypothetical protein